MTHLSTAELAAEVELIADPFHLPNDDDARVPSHLRECELCRERLSELFARHTEVANATHERHLDDLALDALLEVEEGIARPRKEDELLRGHLQRCTVCQERLAALQAEERALALALSTAGESFLREARSKHVAPAASVHRLVRSPSLFSRRTVLSFAAGIGIAVLVPALRGAIMTQGERTVSLVSETRETIRDSVPGFSGKEYVQHVSAGSGVTLTIEGINKVDFDCELYDQKQAKPVAINNGLKSSCQFFIPPAKAGEYRLVVRNSAGSSSEYMMVTQVIRDNSRGRGPLGEPVAP